MLNNRLRELTSKFQIEQEGCNSTLKVDSSIAKSIGGAHSRLKAKLEGDLDDSKDFSLPKTNRI